MDNNILERLRSILEENGFCFGVVASSDGRELARYGEVASLKWKGLLALFEDENAVTNLDLSLEGRILPQIHSQGEVSCLIMKPRKDLVVGLYRQDNPDVEKLFQDGKALSRKLSSEWHDV
jgi:hypothetical protein